MEIKTWMEILFQLEKHPGITISELTRLLTPTHKGIHRLIVTGYVKAMIDIHMVRGERHDSQLQEVPPYFRGNWWRLYTNGKLMDLENEYNEFYLELEKRKRTAQQSIQRPQLPPRPPRPLNFEDEDFE